MSAAALWVAIFFAASWTIGLIVSTRNRLPSNIVTVGLWWLQITLAFVGGYGYLHLLWLMPLALFIPYAISMGHMQRHMAHPSIGYLVMGSTLPVVGPTMAMALL